MDMLPDFAEITPHGGMVIHGRSDATLNPGGSHLQDTGNADAATSAGPSQTLQALQQRADQAMYQAKANGMPAFS